jgi:hypothetical protein
VLVPLAPPMIWTLYVIHRARLKDVGRWSH